MIKPRGWNLYDGRMIEAFGGDFYFKSDYKALERELDGALDRELALNHEILDAKELLHELQLRLAEAEKLLVKAERTPYAAGFHIRKYFEGGPGCADGEKEK